MNQKEFIELIKSIGFKLNDLGIYEFKEFKISLWIYDYNFLNGYEWNRYNYNDLKPIEKHFKNEIRSIKLKELLK